MREHLSAKVFEDITPSDTVPLEPMPFGVYVGGDGDIVAKDSVGNTATFAVLQGVTLAICPRFIMGASTATGLVGLYEDLS